jgi:hypothetical protein
LSYIDEIADAIRVQVEPGLVPTRDVDPLFRIYAVLALSKGERVTLEDVHDAWSAWMAGKDPGHRSLRPLAELPLDVQDADRPYLAAIRTVARDRRLGR